MRRFLSLPRCQDVFVSTQPAKLLFESQVCSRCGGSGSYSYNPMHGSVCYGCGGRGVQLTRRGRAAQEHFNELLQKPVSEVALGDKVLEPGIPDVPGFPARWYTVDEITPDPNNEGRVIISGLDAKGDRYGLHDFATGSVRVAHSQVQRRIFIQQALAYQDTLTKLGTPRKRGVAKAPQEDSIELPVSLFEGI
jgi:hypothetical protein